ncbi:DALR domain-containing protein, partial [Chloroflexota bacterium]
AYTGVKPFVKYWLHNGMVQLGEEKMSKSLGNLITIKEALAKYTADAIRIFILNSHYRSPLTYAEEGLIAAEKGADRLRQAAHIQGDAAICKNGIDTEDYRQRFTTAMDDDFNTAQALASLFDLARDINRASEAGYSITPAQELLKEMAELLGLTLVLPEKPSLDVEPLKQLLSSINERLLAAGLKAIPVDKLPDDVEPLMGLATTTRDQLRKDKHFELADEIRTRLDELGIALEDTSGGTKWKSRR